MTSPANNDELIEQIRELRQVLSSIARHLAAIEQARWDRVVHEITRQLTTPATSATDTTGAGA